MRELNMTEMSDINGGSCVKSILNLIIKTLPYVTTPLLPPCLPVYYRK